MGKNKIEYGLKNVFFATFSISGSVVTYGTPTAHPGAVTMTLKPDGQKTEFYADNGIYFEKSTNNGYTGSLEFALLTDWFKENVLGEVKDTNGVYVEDSNAKINPVAMIYQVEGDANEALHAFYNVVPDRPGLNAGTTTEKIDPKTNTIDVAMRPSSKTGYVKARTSDETTASIKSAWFDAVYVPQIA